MNIAPVGGRFHRATTSISYSELVGITINICQRRLNYYTEMSRIRYILAAIVVGIVVLGINVSLVAYDVGWRSIDRAGPRILCPLDNSPYVWTPIWNENLQWICLRDGHTWKESYPVDVYRQWRNSFLSPEYVRDYTILYLRQIEGKVLPDPLTATWTGGKERAELNLNVTYAYQADGVLVTMEYPWTTPDNMKYTIVVQQEGTTVWQGQLFQRQFIPECECEVHP